MAVTDSFRWQLLKDNAAQAAQVQPRSRIVDLSQGIDVGKIIMAETWNNIVGTVETTAQYCSCHCNYCTCDCNYCTCDCDYCGCQCNYCTCNCAHTCVCNCAY